MSNQPTWIWSYGDFELYHHRKLSLAREERGHIVPAFWQLYGPNCLVKFRKEVELAQAETIRVTSEGDGYLLLDGKRLSYDQSLSLPPGRHSLQLIVGSETGIPAVFVAGDSLCSDESWEATAFDGSWEKAGCWNLNDPARPPSAYELPWLRVEPQAVTESAGGRLVDFGQEVSVRLVLSGLTPGAEYRVCYGESLAEALDDAHAVLSETFRAGGTERVLKGRACRYVRIAGSLERVSGLAEYLPLETKAAFSSSDAMLDRIFTVADTTLRLCSRLFYLDGIKRDGWVWAGDAYQSFLLNYYSHFEPRLIQRTLLALRGGEPVVCPINTILDYSFYWLISLQDYSLYTGDREFIRRVYPKALSLLEFCHRREDEHGLLVGFAEDWTFIDWADMDKRGALCAIQMLYCKALEALAGCAALLGKSEEEKQYTTLAAAVREKIEALFWNAELGAYVTNAIAGRPTAEVRRHANIFAVIYGFADEHKRRRILENVLLNPAVPQITTPYFKFFELDALCRLGQQERVSEILRGYWGGMLNEGATTFWEEYDPSQSGAQHLVMYGEPYDKSLCHAWGAGPLYLLGKYYLGVTPTRPGYAEFEVAPCLGGLERIEGVVPLPRGSVRVKIEAGIVEIETDAEGGFYRGERIEPGRVHRFEVG